MAKVALIQMPFQSLGRPSIGLSLLRGVLEEHGHTVEIKYLNMRYARRIGVNLYRMVSERMPAEALYGEMIFSGMWPDSGEELAPEVRRVMERHLESNAAPRWLMDVLPRLGSEARKLVHTESLAIAQGGFDLAGFNTTFNLSPSLAMAKSLKALHLSLKIALGGASCEGIMGESVLRLFPAVDYVCPGEGEAAILNLARELDLGNGTDAKISGMLSRAQPKAIKTSRWQDLDALPTPQYDDWFRQANEADLGLSEDVIQIPIETSRGCWYGAQKHCTFCGLNGDGLTFRSKSPERVIHDVESALRYGIKNVHAVDNILDFHYFRTVLPTLAERRLPAKLFYEIKSKVTRDQVGLLQRAGVRLVQPGIESLSTPLLELMHKGVAAYHNVRLLKWCEEFGIVPGWNLLYGFPREEKRHYLDMFAMMPLLHHLQPPAACRVRLDRFSPLDFNGSALGVGRRWPPAPYTAIYGVSESDLEDLVYYFDFESEDGNDPDEYGDILKEHVADWQANYCTSALVRVDAEDSCSVFDSRPIARKACERLRGAEFEILRRSDGGARLSDLTDSAPDAELHSAIEKLMERGWLLPIDGRLLSLVVDYTPLIPPSLSEPLWEAFCLELAAMRHRATSVQGTLVADAALEAAALTARSPSGPYGA
jgi:ribosomal peptide maturation radical SAM protein 1